MLYANGFGPTSTPVVAGAVTQSGTLSPLPVVKIGGVTATVQFAGLVSPGEFQFNVVVPPNCPRRRQSDRRHLQRRDYTSGTVITIAGAVAPTSVTFYVAPAGNDSWSGSLAAPNAADTDGPFATFDRARAAVQSINKTGLTQITVQFRGGTYFLPSTADAHRGRLRFGATPIVYQNYPGESPVFSGGVRVRTGRTPAATPGRPRCPHPHNISRICFTTERGGCGRGWAANLGRVLPRSRTPSI